MFMKAGTPLVQQDSSEPQHVAKYGNDVVAPQFKAQRHFNT
jgi:hypothetical protein